MVEGMVKTTVITEEQMSFDYRVLRRFTTRVFVKDRADCIRELAKRTRKAIVQIGEWLAQVKERLPHGQWLPWLQTEFGWTDRTAQRFMQVYMAFKSDNLSNLEIDVSALYLLAAPKTPHAVRVEAIRRAQEGERITHATAQELVEHYERTQETPTPAVARQIAIATGTAIPSTDNTYVLPMSKEEQESLGEEQFHVRNIYSAIEQIIEADVTPEQMAALGNKYFCRNLGPMALEASAWLAAVAKQASQ
jgi:GH24 family phage-related lysozyme (muramidase)